VVDLQLLAYPITSGIYPYIFQIKYGYMQAWLNMLQYDTVPAKEKKKLKPKLLQGL
jgi:hypothetical protein